MKYTIALAGNPNSGKTTLFNALTGASGHVGNWPGVTVEKKEGNIKKNRDMNLVDLPGIYSLSPYTLEEVVARQYLLGSRPDCIINIVDASNLERNLYLTTQILEMGIPVVICANMMDVVRKNGDSLDLEKLSKIFDVPVVPISALQNEGLDTLLSEVEKVCERGQASTYRIPLDARMEETVSEISSKLKDFNYGGTSKGTYMRLNPRWTAIKIFEQDEHVLKDIAIPGAVFEKIEDVEDHYDDDGASLISAARYDGISAILPKVYTKKNPDRVSISDRIDRVVTNRFLALFIFAAVIFSVYYLAISTVGTMATDYVNDTVVGEWAVGGSRTLLEGFGVSEWLISLVSDGIIQGMGAVLGFLPQMMVLFLLLAILEQCGYMSRIAFILDRVFRKFGLSGKSFIPMLIGTGCSVPAIMATRTIENDNDRRMTAITTSFMPCGAKLPIIAFFGGVIFGNVWWFGPLFYFIGIAAVIISGIVLKKTRRFQGNPAPFIMELPEYRIPKVSDVLRTVWERSAAFIKKAGTIILLSTIIIWALQYFGMTEEGFVAVGDRVDESFLADIGRLFAWIFVPLGFGNWQATVGSMAGLVAKENLMSTYGVLFGVQGDVIELIENADFGSLTAIAGTFTAASAFSFLLFNLLCAPCFASIGAMHRELGDPKWTIFGVAYQSIFGYSAGLIFYQTLQLIYGNITIWTFFALAVLLVWLYLLFRKNPAKTQKVYRSHEVKEGA